MNQYDVLVVGGGFGGAFAAAAPRAPPARPGRARAARRRRELLPLLAAAARGGVGHARAAPRRHPAARVPARARRSSPARSRRLDVDGRRAKVVDLNGDAHEVAFRSLILSPGSRADDAADPRTARARGRVQDAARRDLAAQPRAAPTRSRRRRPTTSRSASELLTFTFIGGGYSGVEALAELESLTRDALKRSYPRLRSTDMRWVLVEADRHAAARPRRPPRPLRRAGAAAPRASSCTCDARSRVARTASSRFSDATVAPFASGTIVWTAGQRPSDAAPRQRARRRRARPRARSTSTSASPACPTPSRSATPPRCPIRPSPGAPCPPTAQHALRQGIAAADNVAAGFGVGDRRAVPLPQPRPRRHPRPQPGRRPGEALHLHRPAGLVHGPLLPPADDAGPGPQVPRRQRLDDLAVLPARRLAARRARTADAAQSARGLTSDGEPRRVDVAARQHDTDRDRSRHRAAQHRGQRARTARLDDRSSCRSNMNAMASTISRQSTSDDLVDQLADHRERQLARRRRLLPVGDRARHRDRDTLRPRPATARRRRRRGLDADHA